MKLRSFFIVTTFFAVVLAIWFFSNHQRALAERCYDYVDPLRVKVGQTEFRVPRHLKLDLQEESGQTKLIRVPVFERNTDAVKFEGYCQSADALPLQASLMSLSAEGREIKQLHMTLLHMDYADPSRPTYCSERPHLSEYKPCRDLDGFMCRDIQSKSRLGPKRYILVPDAQITGIPVIFACFENTHSDGQFCELFVRVSRSAALFYTDYRLFTIKEGEDGKSSDGQKLMNIVRDIDGVLHSVMSVGNAANDLHSCLEN